MTGLSALDAAVEVLRSRVSAFAQAGWRHRPTALGVRESRHLVGRHWLEGTEVRRAARFEDAVAVGAWPIELWHGPTHQALTPIAGRTYDVPLGALRARDRDDVFAAGRCLSASHEALGSIRVLGGCFETGQAAGAAAALQALHGQVTAADVQPWRTWGEA